MSTKLHAKPPTREIKKLRRKKLSEGMPFMINSDMLPSHQCYLEYPDGSIKIVEADPEKSNFKIIEELDFLNAEHVRRMLKLGK